jgi:putative flippase GtrA
VRTRRHSSWPLWAGALIAAELVVLLAMHFPSNGSGFGNVLTRERFPGYWRAFHEHVASLEQWAARPGTPDGLVHAGILVAGLAAGTIAYLLLLRTLARLPAARRPGPLPLYAIAATASAPLLFLPFMLSTDVYSYSIYGRIFALHGDNPYLVSPRAYRDDPFFEWLFWTDTKLVYGPLWLYVAGAVTHVAEWLGGGVTTYVIAFKLTSLGFHGINAGLIWTIVRRRDVTQASLAVAFYLLNPLLLLEFAGNGHNDSIALCFVLLGLRAHLDRRDGRAGVYLMCAALVKVYVLPLVAVHVVWRMWRSGGAVAAIRTGAIATAAAFAVAAIAYAPVWDGLATLAPYYKDSASQFLLNSLAELFSVHAPADVVKRVFLAAFAAALIALALRARRTETLIDVAVWYGLAFCVLGATWFWPWYASLALVAAAISDDRLARRCALILGATAPAVYVGFALGLPRGSDAVSVLARAIHGHRAAIVFAPVVLAAALPLVRLILRVATVRRFARFALVGCSGMAVNLGVLWGWMQWGPGFAWQIPVGTALAIVVSIFTNFLLNDGWTWRDRRGADVPGWTVRLGRYYGSAAAGAVVQWLVAQLVGALGVHYLAATMCGIAAATACNYLALEHWVFRRT